MNLKQCLPIISLFILGISFGQGKNFVDQPYIDTTARIDTLVVPDRIYLSIILDESDSKDRIPVEAQENKMATVLEKLGIDTKDQLFLADLSTNFQDYFLRRKGVVKAKRFELMLYDALSAAEAIQALETAGISNVQFHRAELSELEDLKLLLRSQAVEQAVKQAEALLRPLGQKPGKVLHISDMNTGIIEGWRSSNMRMAVQSAEQEPIEVDFKKIKVSCSLNVKFMINYQD